MDIKGYEGLYKIYEDGRVWGCRFKKFLKPGIKSTGYYHCSLCKKGKVNNFLIHRLIALHYIENPNNYLTVDHINRLRTDNRIENLRWASRSTQQENRTLHANNKLKLTNISYNPRDKLYYIQIRRKKINYQKYAKTEEEAIVMRDKLLEEID